MMLNLRAVVARSIRSRNFASCAHRKRNGRSSNESMMGGKVVGGNIMTVHEHNKLLGRTRATSSIPGILVFWTCVGYGGYAASERFRTIRPNRQRREEAKLIEQRADQVESRWKQLSKQAERR